MDDKHKKIWSHCQKKIRRAYKSHFKWRIGQRYRIKITDEEIEAVIASLSAKPRVGVMSLGVQPRKRSVKLVCIRGKEVVVVYSKSLKALVTALPIGCKHWKGIEKEPWAQDEYQRFCEQVGI